MSGMIHGFLLLFLLSLFVFLHTKDPSQELLLAYYELLLLSRECLALLIATQGYGNSEVHGTSTEPGIEQ